MKCVVFLLLKNKIKYSPREGGGKSSHVCAGSMCVRLKQAPSTITPQCVMCVSLGSMFSKICCYENMKFAVLLYVSTAHQLHYQAVGGGGAGPGGKPVNNMV